MIIIISIAFVVMLLFPIVGAYWFYKKVKGDILYINQDRIRDPRYFAVSFTKMMDKQFESFEQGESLHLSREEKILLADEIINYPNPCEAVVIAEKYDFNPPGKIEFNKEIYAMKNSKIMDHVQIRAIACKKDLVIGSNVRILRWADAVGKLIAKDDCDLGISTTSTKEIVIGNRCDFRRLYAPEIYLGQKEKTKIKVEDNLNKLNDFNLLGKIKYDLKYIDESMANNDGIIDFSIVSKYSLTVLEDLTINGNIRSGKKLRICDNVKITGNVFVEDDIFIGRNVVILGTVFSQGNIKVEEGSVIGKKNSISSVIARGTITFEKNCVVYGYISNEQGGQTY